MKRFDFTLSSGFGFAVLITINAKTRRAIMGGTLACGASDGRSWASLTTRLRYRPPVPRLGLFHMPLFLYRCPKTGYRVQGFASENVVEDHHVYEPVTCPVCHQIHHVNPTTGVVLAKRSNNAASVSRLLLEIDVGECLAIGAVDPGIPVVVRLLDRRR
jgi:hypothetical protein